jgi:transcriptional regulator GlxA family with amidase domain
LLFGLELVRERLGQQRSQRFDTKTLVANARRSKSQQRLLAISQLRSLEPEVTDVLVTRGDQEVVRSLRLPVPTHRATVPLSTDGHHHRIS